MKSKSIDGIVGYHYTNPEAYKSMQTKGVDGFYTKHFDEFIGLIPSHRFSGRSAAGLPDEANNAVIEGLLKPEPREWITNPTFPHIWNCLMHDICRHGKVILLSFEIKPEDKAYVVDRAHVEHELYREAKGQGQSNAESLAAAMKKYWESRVSIFDYDGKYELPQLAIWSGIPFERLKVEWVKPTEEVWKRVIDNDW